MTRFLAKDLKIHFGHSANKPGPQFQWESICGKAYATVDVLPLTVTPYEIPFCSSCLELYPACCFKRAEKQLSLSVG